MNTYRGKGMAEVADRIVLGSYFQAGRPVQIDPTPLEDYDDPPWLEVAVSELGVREAPGTASNARILEYHQYTLLQADQDEVPWCSAFVNWVMAVCSIPRTNSPLARSWLDWGQQLTRPRRGAICILRRGSASWTGHVGFWMGTEGFVDNHLLLLGGNQKDAVSVQSYPDHDLLDCRWPLDEWIEGESS